MKNKKTQYLNHHDRGNKDLEAIKEKKRNPQVKKDVEFASEIAPKDYFGGISTKKIVENVDKKIVNKPNTMKNNKY